MSSSESHPADAPPEYLLVDAGGTGKLAVSEVRNRIVQGDAINVLKRLPDASFDMVFLDPPYFLQLPKKNLKRWNAKTDVSGVDDAWDKFSSFEEYDKFIAAALEEVRRVMKPAATVWAISTYHSMFRIGRVMQDTGFWFLNDVVWLKTNPMPNWLGVRFTNATETLIWAARDKKAKKYTFNKEFAKEAGVGKVGANVWVIPLCTGSERLKNKEGKKLHSTQKPLELLKRVILTSTKEGDLVLDPMAGTGTTGYVARALGRDFVMIEANPVYVEGAVRRLEAGDGSEIIEEPVKHDQKLPELDDACEESSEDETAGL